MKRIIYIGLLLFTSLGAQAQSAKQFIKEGTLDMNSGLYKQAIEKFYHAVQADPRNTDIYIPRAECYLNLNDTLNAAKDYEIVARLDKDPVKYYYLASKFYFRINEFNKAKETALESTMRDKKNNLAWTILIKIALAQNNIEKGLTYANSIMENNDDGLSLYYAGEAFRKNNTISKARNAYEKAIIENQNLLEAYLRLADIQLANGEIQYAIDNCNFILQKDIYNYKASYLRSRAFFILRDAENALNDITKTISLQPKPEYFFTRGKYNFEFGNFSASVQDFSVVIAHGTLLDSAYYYRARAFEKFGQKKLAVKDYRYLSLHPDIVYNDSSMLEMVEKKIYALNFENHKPGIHIQQPYLTDKNEIPVENGTVAFMLKGAVIDENIISSVSINNENISFDSDSIGHAAFSINYICGNSPYITISATDLYGNTSSSTHAIVEIENEKPIIKVISPQANNENFIFIDNDDQYLYLEGYISDKSAINKIQIDNTTASYKIDEINPRFTATINVKNKNSITVKAEDEYNNTSEIHYKIIRGKQLAEQAEPMGKTWVVIIENATYKNYSNLVSPPKDAAKLKAALANYQINHIIHKQNMTKREMERFFAIDLRNLVKSNKVESLLIYYTGHGDYQNETGYWIPVDADVDDEFANFNVNALKASLYSYTTLQHLLVVIDACLAGPAFQVAMKGPIQEYNCNDTTLISQRSFQAFTSANTSFALDNSEFSSHFIENLDNNTNSCLSIDAIATRVISKMKTTAVQEPVYGRIVGLRDEQGTFFFFKK